MTLITLYYKKPKFKNDAEGIICLADSLISNIEHPESSITEQAMKILSLTFRYNIETDSYPKLFPNEIGIAYAGHTSIALQTYNIVRTCCLNLSPSNPNKHFGPSLSSIAHFVGNILVHYYKNYGSTKPNSPMIFDVKFVIFGFCFTANDFKAYMVKIDTDNNIIKYVVEDINIKNLPFYSFGTGKVDFENFYAQNPINVEDSFRSFLDSNISRKKGVGGYVQKCFASIGHFNYYADFSINEEGLLNMVNAQVAGFRVNGAMIDDYMIAFNMHPFLK